MKRYTAQEMRVRADYEESEYANIMAAEMLRQAANILDCIQKEIDGIEKMPTADLDGSFANQRVNGERLVAKIEFFQKVKKIVGEVRE